MNYKGIKYCGKSLYQTNIPKEMKRYLVFLGRCCLHKKEIENMERFFQKNALRQELLEHNPSFLEQVTRHFFYAGASWTERIKLVQHHVSYLEKKTKPEFLTQLYVEKKAISLWTTEVEGESLAMELCFHPGHRKEGCLSLTLRWKGHDFYQIMFWLGPGFDKKPALWMGAIQGTSLGNEAVKTLTKTFFGYRTKNLIFYGMRQVARCLGCAHIYGVTNKGYYAMNHLRLNRKLKTDFGLFWEECEGVCCVDDRFYQIPIAEKRKDMSELKPSKRASHRRRYELMDTIKMSVAGSLAPFLQD